MRPSISLSNSPIDLAEQSHERLDQLAAERVLTGRRVAFVGNCQMFKLSNLYRNSLTTGLHGAANNINPQLELTVADRSVLEQADCVIWQVADVANKIDRSIVPASARVIDVPLISAVFLWPFAGRAHPRNERVPHAPNGPFDPELGDTFLNSLIAEGVAPDEAASRYVSLDFSKRINLDRLYELWFEAQRRRDRATGFDILDMIVGRFRSEQVFLTPHHPGLEVFQALAGQVFERMGYSSATISRVLGTLKVSPFWPDSRPIHPFVARHFGLSWVGPEHRYPLRHEGEFTFAEFARRYVAYEWNEALVEGISGALEQNPTLARQRLQEGLHRSPNATTGHIRLSHTCLREGDVEAALAAASVAVRLDERNCHGHFALGLSLLRSGCVGEAETALRRSLALRPPTATVSLELARLYVSQKRFDEAHSVIVDARQVFPHELALLLIGAKVLLELGKLDEAEEILREAIAVKPVAAEPYCHLADVLALKARRIVVANYRAVVGQIPDSANAQAGLGLLQVRFGDYAQAETAFRSAVALCPGELGSKIQLATIICRQGRNAEALSLATELERDSPADPRVRTLLARLRNGRPEGKGTDDPGGPNVPPGVLAQKQRPFGEPVSPRD